MAQNLVFYFAWVDATDTTFDSSYARFDENVLYREIEGNEGQFTTATVRIRNPQRGLLSGLVWVWLSASADGGVTIKPEFFGRLVGMPTKIESASLVVDLRFIARPLNYVQQKQSLAETLKNLPAYDPLFYDILKRDDPDSILEAYSALYHVDRVTGVVSISDVLTGEDGTVNFTGYGTVSYDSIKMDIGQSPLVAVNVKTNIAWTQQWTGFFDVTSGQILTFTGESFINEWPKTGSNLGGGYSVSVGFAANATREVDIAQTLGNYSYHYHWQNTQKMHQTGDTMSVDFSYSVPVFGGSGIEGSPTMAPSFGNFSYPGGAIAYCYKFNVQSGLQNPFNQDANGDPDPINRPFTADVAWLVIPQWQAVYALSLRYDANRKRTERLEFTLQADVQPTITDALAVEDTEVITISAANPDLPLFSPLNWQSVAGQPVALDTYIFPNNPYAVGQTSTQICTTAGTAGIIEPLFSNIAGTTTIDGTVVWTSLGYTQPLNDFADWQRSVPVGRGSLICPRPVAAQDITSLALPGILVFPPRAVAVSQFQLLCNGDAVPGTQIFEVTIPGFLSGFAPITSSIASLSEFTNPTGKSVWLCTTAGTTSLFRSSWPDTLGATVTDGTSVWTNVGPADLAIGGWPGFVGASSYFPSARGLQSLEHLILRARARLRWRSRAVQISWECPYANAMMLTCRMNASVYAPMLPIGNHHIASGKVISYKLVADPENGRAFGQVTIGCAVGNGNELHVSSGSQVYVINYVDPGYLQIKDGQNVVSTNDVGYTPPVPATIDDGLIFPVAASDVIIDQMFEGSAAAEQILIAEAIQNAEWSNLNSRTLPASAIGGTATYSVTEPDWLSLSYGVENQTLTGIWYTLSLRPLTNGPFDAGFVVETTLLMIEKTVDLEN